MYFRVHYPTCVEQNFGSNKKKIKTKCIESNQVEEKRLKLNRFGVPVINVEMVVADPKSLQLPRVQNNRYSVNQKGKEHKHFCNLRSKNHYNILSNNSYPSCSCHRHLKSNNSNKCNCFGSMHNKILSNTTSNKCTRLQCRKKMGAESSKTRNTKQGKHLLLDQTNTGIVNHNKFNYDVLGENLSGRINLNIDSESGNWGKANNCNLALNDSVVSCNDSQSVQVLFHELCSETASNGHSHIHLETVECSSRRARVKQKPGHKGCKKDRIIKLGHSDEMSTTSRDSSSLSTTFVDEGKIIQSLPNWKENVSNGDNNINEKKGQSVNNYLHNVVECKPKVNLAGLLTKVINNNIKFRKTDIIKSEDVLEIECVKNQSRKLNIPGIKMISNSSTNKFNYSCVNHQFSMADRSFSQTKKSQRLIHQQNWNDFKKMKAFYKSQQISKTDTDSIDKLRKEYTNRRRTIQKIRKNILNRGMKNKISLKGKKALKVWRKYFRTDEILLKKETSRKWVAELQLKKIGSPRPDSLLFDNDSSFKESSLSTNSSIGTGTDSAINNKKLNLNTKNFVSVDNKHGVDGFINLHEISQILKLVQCQRRKRKGKLFINRRRTFHVVKNDTLNGLANKISLNKTYTGKYCHSIVGSRKWSKGKKVFQRGGSCIRGEDSRKYISSKRTYCSSDVNNPPSELDNSKELFLQKFSRFRNCPKKFIKTNSEINEMELWRHDLRSKYDLTDFGSHRVSPQVTTVYIVNVNCSCNHSQSEEIELQCTCGKECPAILEQSDEGIDSDTSWSCSSCWSRNDPIHSSNIFRAMHKMNLQSREQEGREEFDPGKDNLEEESIPRGIFEVEQIECMPLKTNRAPESIKPPRCLCNAQKLLESTTGSSCFDSPVRAHCTQKELESTPPSSDYDEEEPLSKRVSEPLSTSSFDSVVVLPTKSVPCPTCLCPFEKCISSESIKQNSQGEVCTCYASSPQNLITDHAFGCSCVSVNPQCESSPRNCDNFAEDSEPKNSCNCYESSVDQLKTTESNQLLKVECMCDEDPNLNSNLEKNKYEVNQICPCSDAVVQDASDVTLLDDNGLCDGMENYRSPNEAHNCLCSTLENQSDGSIADKSISSEPALHISQQNAVMIKSEIKSLINISINAPAKKEENELDGSKLAVAVEHNLVQKSISLHSMHKTVFSQDKSVKSRSNVSINEKNKSSISLPVELREQPEIVKVELLTGIKQTISHLSLGKSDSVNNDFQQYISTSLKVEATKQKTTFVSDLMEIPDQTETAPRDVEKTIVQPSNAPLDLTNDKNDALIPEEPELAEELSPNDDFQLRWYYDLCNKYISLNEKSVQCINGNNNPPSQKIIGQEKSSHSTKFQFNISSRNLNNRSKKYFRLTRPRSINETLKLDFKPIHRSHNCSNSVSSWQRQFRVNNNCSGQDTGFYLRGEGRQEKCPTSNSFSNDSEC